MAAETGSTGRRAIEVASKPKRMRRDVIESGGSNRSCDDGRRLLFQKSVNKLHVMTFFAGARTIGPFMSVKILTSIGFAAHVLLGNVCMMPMAGAAEMPVSHEEHMEMAMTPMSSVDCEYCIKEQSNGVPMKGMPCNGGHCLSKSVPQASTAIQASSLLAAVTLPVGILLPSAPLELHGSPNATAPPGVPVSTDTVVLHC